ncbi:MAG: DUF2493 domain-containing protein [Halieaceae bacterium]|nr:DUF2493 domain-containing protein [Halieaceae bacterium]
MEQIQIPVECYECGKPSVLNYRSRCSDCQSKFESSHFKIVVAGGRTFADYELMKRKLDVLLAKRDNLMIISGTAGGADRLGERYAEEREVEILRMPANWEAEGRSAGYKRNVRMAERADAVCVFWDGKSKGSKHMIDIARHHNLPLRVITY